MAKYVFVAYLLTEASVPRITQAFLDRGYSVGPWFDSNGLFAKSENAGAVILSLLIEDEADRDIDAASSKFNTILKHLKVPFFGSFVTLPTSDICMGFGNIPATPKKQAPSPQPPKRKADGTSNVVQLFPANSRPTG